MLSHLLVLGLLGEAEPEAPADEDVTAFRARFPGKFDAPATPDAAITYALSLADQNVDDSWMAGDIAEAKFLYAAHSLTLDGYGVGPGAQLAGMSGIRRMKSGALDVEFADGGGAGGLSSTTYGQRYAALLRRNRGGPLVSGGLPAGCRPWIC